MVNLYEILIKKYDFSIFQSILKLSIKKSNQKINFIFTGLLLIGVPLLKGSYALLVHARAQVNFN